jgi:predicted small secreted protein
MMKKNIKKSALCISVLCISLLVSACGTSGESVQEHAYPESKQPVEEAGNTSVPNADAKNDNDQGNASGEDGKPTAQSESTESSEQIDIVIDQSNKPMEGNSFDFGIKQVPKGYALTEMRWTSNTVTIVNSLQEAIEHGENGEDGEDGFYFSGNGQFSGFIYSDEMKGERGKATFVFTNDEGNMLMSEKEITLK